MANDEFVGNEMVSDTDIDARLQEALARKSAAREKLHLKGFGGNRHPKSSRVMSDEDAREGLANLAKAAWGMPNA